MPQNFPEEPDQMRTTFFIRSTSYFRRGIFVAHLSHVNPYLKNFIRAICILAALSILYEAMHRWAILKYLIRFDLYINPLVVAAYFAGRWFSGSPMKSAIVEQDPVNLLSAQEKRVLEMIAKGKTNKEIAGLSFIEMSTVKTHINKIFAKLGVKNRTEAIQVFKKYTGTQNTNFPGS